MMGTRTNTVLCLAVGWLLLGGCGAAKPATGASPTVAAASGASGGAPAAITTTATTGGAGSVTACGLITQQDATTAIGSPAGPGTAGGTPALSECIYDDGALIVSVETNGKALYDRSHTNAHAKGATDVPGVGDGAFEAGTDQNSTLLFIKGTTLVSIIFNGARAQDAAVEVAKVAASKM